MDNHSNKHAMFPDVTSKDVIDHSTRKLFGPGSLNGVVLFGLVILVVMGIVGFLVRAFGDGFSDSARSSWGYYAAMYAFLLMTAGSAPVVAVAFRWTRNHWRRPLSRASELFALVGVINVIWFIPLMFLLPGIDLNGDGALALGQDRRTIWFEVPIGAPLWWDTLAVIFLFLTSVAILWVSARPDLASVAVYGRGWRAKLMKKLAMGWRGTERDWVLQKGSLTALGGLYFMMLVYVHTLISLDFCLSLVPGWKDSIFAPWHVLTGFQAAAGTVLLTLFLMRTFGGYSRFIGLTSFWSFSKVLLGLTLLWGYFWFSEFMTFWYGRMPSEMAVIKLIMFESYKNVFIVNVFFSFLIPFGLLLWNGIRKSILGPTLAGISAIIGAFFMVVRLYVPAFNIPTADMGHHSIADFEAAAGQIAPQLMAVPPDVWDIFIILGGIGGVALLFLLSTRIIPLMSIWETKEGLLYMVVRPLLKSRYLVVGKPE